LRIVRRMLHLAFRLTPPGGVSTVGATRGARLSCAPAPVTPRPHSLRDTSMSIQMELNKIIISEMQDQQIIVLKEVDGERKFPIVIGSSEAYAIDRRLKGIPTPRPLTHDLLAQVIEQLGGTIDHIEINNLQDHTFFASIHIRRNGELVEIDSRPSDAIALGIATTVPIYVAEHVLDEVC
jgi:bifunctional DNase/RNase